MYSVYKNSKMSKIGGSKVLHSQSREIVANVVKFMTDEAEKGVFIIDPKKIIERVSAATGVSKRSITRIKKEAIVVSEGSSSYFSTPKKHPVRPKPVSGIDDFDVCVIRRIVNNFYVQEKCLPTVNKILKKLADDNIFHGSSRTLRRVLHDIGFKWSRIKPNRSIITERHDIQYQKFIYLKRISDFRKEGRPIVYIDETYIDSSHSQSKGWGVKKPDKSSLKKPVSKGSRTIILHAGGKMGFITNCLTMWKSRVVSGDYHHNMNFTNFSKWLREKLIPNLPPSSVVVLDNAPYHNVKENKAPKTNARKEIMIDWLRLQNISFPQNALKLQLYEIIKQNKAFYEELAVDKILQEHGHDVLRLPAYHPELNPIELIWADVKNWVAARNVTFLHDDVIKLCTQKFNSIGPEQWKPKIDHCLEIEVEYRNQQGVLENAIDSFIIDLGENSETSEGSDIDDSSTEEDLSGVEEL